VSAQPSVLQVVILRDGLLVGTEVFVPGTYSVGSDPSSDLRLDDASIEPRHAMLYFQNGRSAIQDAGSSQGVYVNGHRVSACEIRSVDEVLCGPFVLKTRVLSQKPAADKPLPSPEVAALLGGAPQPAAPQAAVRPLRPAPQAATMPARASAGGGLPAVQGPSATAVLASTVPLAAVPQSIPRGPAPQAVVPMPQPAAQAQHRGGASHGGGAVAHAQRPMPAPAAMPAPVPANTVPSARRRATQDLMPAQEAVPSIQLADDLFGDLLPSLEAPPEDEAPAPEEVASPPRPSPVAIARPAPRPAPVAAPAMREAPRKAHAPVQARAEPGRPATAPKMGPGKGPPQLYLELYWGDARSEARRFQGGKKPLQAAADELAGMPLWGFTLPTESFTLAESINGAYRLYVPPGSSVEQANSGSRYLPVQLSALEGSGTRRFLTLRDGTAARLSQGQMSLVAYAAPKPEKVWVNPLAGLPWLALFFFFLIGGGFGSFLVLRPPSSESPDFTARNLPPVALRLLAPEPKKKEEAKKKAEALKEKSKPEKKPEKVAEKPPPKPVEKTPPPKAVAPPPPESKALKALAKLSAAGPATNDVLAAVDKLGSGPGSKNAKTSNYKLSGLIGKAPIANAGLGTFGLGGGGKGGGATLGAELLHGKGGGGIGALGAGGVGKGQVGGVVTKATSRSVAAQGSIDREAVAKVINSHLQEVYSCYERVLLKDAGLAGKVVLEWTIGSNGSVVVAKTKSSTLRNGAVEACILSSLKKWSFPSPKGGVVVISYPFIFNSVGY
jgi:outer membrane biosynthesis protein TonB